MKNKAVKTNRNLFGIYLKEISKIPILTAEEERRLAKLMQGGDEDAMRRLVESNLRFVILVARKLQKPGMLLLDLINEGNLGLLEAARRFDPDRGVRFLTYAVWWIRQAIFHYQSHDGKLIPLGSRINAVLSKVAKINDAGDSSKTSTRSMARKLGISTKELDRALQYAANVVSLDAPLNDAGQQLLGETLRQELFPSQDHVMIHLQRSFLLNQLMSKLEDKEAKVLRMRFGIDGGAAMTLQEIGDKIGLSRERIRQIEKSSIEKLRPSLNGS